MFVATYYANRINPTYDFTLTVSDDSINNGTIAFADSMNQYQRTINKVCDFNIVSDSIQFKNFSANINNGICTAEIETSYYYDIVGAFNETCNINCIFYFTLVQGQNGWRITEVRTSMPYEAAPNFQYGAFDVTEAVKYATEVVAVSNNSKAKDASDIQPDVIYPLGYTDYDVNAAISYAEQYYYRINSKFGSASGGDCQNFASQCVWAGLLEGCNATGSSITARPAVSTSLVGSSARNVWCHNQSSTYYSDPFFNWAWDNVGGFLKLIDSNDYTCEGPHGAVYSGVAYARPGDVIYFDAAGLGNLVDFNYDHAMFVTNTTGTVGSRTTANIFIAAHNNYTTSAYMPLVNYCSYPDSYFATARIYWGYYRVSGADVPSSPVIID